LFVVWFCRDEIELSAPRDATTNIFIKQNIKIGYIFQEK